jgi:hypothetical protein
MVLAAISFYAKENHRHIHSAFECVGTVLGFRKADAQAKLNPAPMGSFEVPCGQRRLARRDSDVKWLNMALQV